MIIIIKRTNFKKSMYSGPVSPNIPPILRYDVNQELEATHDLWASSPLLFPTWMRGSPALRHLKPGPGASSPSSPSDAKIGWIKKSCIRPSYLSEFPSVDDLRRDRLFAALMESEVKLEWASLERNQFLQWAVRTQGDLAHLQGCEALRLQSIAKATQIFGGLSTWTGITFETAVSPSRVIVSTVAPTSAAAAAGLREGMRIECINNLPIRSVAELALVVVGAQPGDRFQWLIRFNRY
jgi:hypothetical protein